MDTQELRRHRDAEPFEPFSLVLEDASEVAIEQRDDLYIPPVPGPYVWASGEDGGPRPIGLKSIVGVRKLHRPPSRKVG